MWKTKLFADPIGQLKPRLNKMAESGYRLVDVKNFLYKFEKSEEKYYYDTQFIGANPYKVNKDYREFIESSNFNTFTTPLNQGQLSLGKIRLRMFAKGSGKVATRPGNFGKEILILESKADKKEKLLTNNVDIANEYKETRNAYG